MGKAPLTPGKLKVVCVDWLKKGADPVRAAGAQRYFKDTIRCYGLTAPRVRELALRAHGLIKDEWDVRTAADFCGLMLADPFFEVKAIGVLVLERFKKGFPRSLFRTIHGWLAADLCDNWATVDTLCPASVGALLERYPDLVPKIQAWSRSPNRWVRRASLVSFLKLTRKSGFLEPIYQTSKSLFADADDLVQKANGWLLREAGKADPGRLEEFLKANGPAIPRTTLRYAIERFAPEKRRALLQSTRPART